MVLGMAKKRQPIDDLIDAHVALRRQLTEQTARCDYCRNYISSTCTEQSNELRHFVTSSNLRSAACAPFWQRNQDCPADVRGYQDALGSKYPAVEIVFAAGLRQQDD
jgi:hypothetical protein